MKELIGSMMEADDVSLVPLMEEFTSQRDRPRGDLCPWIPLLNRFDSCLETFVKKYSLQDEHPVPMAVNPEDEAFLVSILNFTVFLLEKCSNRSIYASMGHVLCLLKSTSIKLVSAAADTLSKLPPKLAQVRIGVGKLTVSSGYEQIVRQLATILPIDGQQSINTFLTATIADFIDPSFIWSDEWSAVNLNYYAQQQSIPLDLMRSATPPPQPPSSISSPTQLSTPTKASTKDMGSGSSKKPVLPKIEGLSSFSISADEVKSSTTQALIDKACSSLPVEVWFNAINKIRIAKACDNSAEGLALRQELVKIEFHSLVFFCLAYEEDHTESMILSKSPNLLKQIADLIPAEPSAHIPVEATILALETLLEVSQQPARRSEVVNVLSVNVSHGSLMSLIRQLISDMKEGKEINEDFSTLVFMLLSSLATFHQVGSSLASAGLISLLLDILKIENSPFIRTFASVVELIDHIIIDVPSTFPIFLESQGIELLIKAAEREISYCVSPDRPKEILPTFCTIDYQLSYYRTQWIRSLFVVISNVLVQTRNTANLQSMVDSSLLKVSGQVITNPQIFGCRIVSLNLQILANMLEHESTAYGIMSEAHVISILIEQFDRLLSLGHGYFGPMAKIVSALAHNEGGLKVVEEQNLIEKLFKTISLNLGTKVKDSLPSVAAALDGMISEHAELRPIVVKQVIKLIDFLSNYLNDSRNMTPSESFYDGRATDYIEGLPATEIVHTATNTTYYVVEQVVSFLEAITKSHLTRVELINQDALLGIVNICTIRDLPFDFAYTKAGFALGKILRSLFTLDIKTKNFENVFCEKLLMASQNVLEALNDVAEPPLMFEDDTHTPSYYKMLSVLNSLLQMFHDMVFFDCGTGYRVVCLMEHIVKMEAGGQKLISLLSEVLNYAIWNEALIGQQISDRDLIKATSLICVEGAAANANQVRAVKQAVDKIEEDKPGITKSSQFRKCRAYRFLNSSTRLIVAKILSEFGNACCSEKTVQPTRWTDAARERKKCGVRMAEVIATGIFSLLESERIAADDFSIASLQYLLNVLLTLQQVLIKLHNEDLSVALSVLVQFKQIGGVMKLMSIFMRLWKSPLNCRLPGDASPETVMVHKVFTKTLQLLLSLVTPMVSYNIIFASRRLVAALENPQNKQDFKAHQFFIEIKLMVLWEFIKIWNSDQVYKPDAAVCKGIVGLLQKLLISSGEGASPEVNKSNLPRNLDWRTMPPTEAKLKELVRLGFPERDSKKALLDQDDSLVRAASQMVKNHDSLSELQIPEKELEIPVVIGLAPVTETGEKLVLRSDLEKLRSTIDDQSLCIKLLGLCELHEDCIFPATDLLLKRATVGEYFQTETQRESVSALQSQVIRTLLEAIVEGSESRVTAASHILGKLINDDSFFKGNFEALMKKQHILLEKLELEDSQTKSWYPNILLIIEKILSNTDIPIEEPSQHGGTLAEYPTAVIPKVASDGDTVSSDAFRQRVFAAISKAQSFNKDISALATGRLYVMFAKDYKTARTLYDNGVVDTMVKCLHQFSDSPIIKNLLTVTTMLLRFTIETPEMVKKTMYNELKHYFKGHPRMEIEMLMKSSEKYISRSPEIFVDVIGELCMCTNEDLLSTLGTKDFFDSKKKKLENIIKNYKETPVESGSSDVKEDEEMAEAKVSSPESLDKPTIPAAGSSGVVEILLTELFSISKSDLFKDIPEKPKEDDSKDIPVKESFNRKENCDFMYGGFLMQILTELLQSYNCCKMELLNFKKKNLLNINSSITKPRSYALARLLNEYVPNRAHLMKGSVVVSGGTVAKKKTAISSLGKALIVSLVSATGELGILPNEEEIYGEPTLIFVRKFVLDCIAKSIRDTQAHLSLSMEHGFAALISFSELCYDLLSHSNKYYRSEIIDGASTAKLMFEKNFGNLFSSIFAELDLNYPGASDVAKCGLRLCLGISRLTLPADSVPEGVVGEHEDQHEGFDSDSYDDYRDETPNLFRNSTLGMFETDNIYDDDDEELAEDDIEEDDDDHHYHGPDDNDMFYEEVDSDAYSDVEDNDDHEETYAFTGDVGDVESDDSESGSDINDMGSVEFVVEEVLDEDEDMDSELDDDDFSVYSIEGDDDEEVEGDQAQQLASELLESLNEGNPPPRFGHRSRMPPSPDVRIDPTMAPREPEDPPEFQFTEYEDGEDEDEDDNDSDIDNWSSDASEGQEFFLDSGHRVRADRAFMSLLAGEMDRDDADLQNPLLVNRRQHSSNLFWGSPNRLISLFDLEDGADSNTNGSLHGDIGLFSDFRRAFHDISADSLSHGLLSGKPNVKHTVARWNNFCLMLDVFTKASVRNILLSAIYNRIYAPSVEALKEIHSLEEEIRELKAEAAKEKAKKEEEIARKQREAAENERREQEKRETQDASSNSEEENDEEMEGIADLNDHPAEPVFVVIGGREIDVSALGVDPAFLEALPDEIRDEAFTAHLREMLSTARANGQEASDVLDPEFLDALPSQILNDLDLGTLRASGDALEGAGQVFDNELMTFMASLDPPLRQALLLEQDEETLARLPPEFAEQAHQLQNQVVASFAEGINLGSGRIGRRRSGFQEYGTSDDDEELPSILRESDNIIVDTTESERKEKPEPKRHVTAAHLHLMDKSGIAALVRLFYLPQSARQRELLNELLLNLCNNKQNRGDILNFLLHILQDGSADRHSIEKGFVMTTNRAVFSTPTKSSSSGTNKNMTTPKSTSKTGSHANFMLNESVSPMIVTQQVLEALEYLVRYSGSVKVFFLREHDSALGSKKLKAKKGKERDLRESKYPINMLFHLLDRPVARDSFTLELLSALIQEVTKPLPILLNEEDSKNDAEGETSDDKGKSKTDDNANVNVNAEVKSEDPGKSETSKNSKAVSKFAAPYIPEKLLKKICTILTTKECSGRTFQQILNVIHNLSAIPGVVDFIGQELLSQATAIGPIIVSDLRSLTQKVESAARGSDVQGAVLAKFSSGSSDQAKLLRLLTAIDHLFVPETSEDGSQSDAQKQDEAMKLLSALYEQMTFGNLWEALSNCLRLIQERKDMIHVATALLPLIESLMVFCKHSRVKDIQVREGSKKDELHPTFEFKKFDIANEPLESLFFSFSDEHRKILNQMIRNNPKLMSGSFSILFKNPKALEFDNKRRFFYRKIYNSSSHSFGDITLNVRRDQVFLDSYKALFFKSADEIKYCNLNIRFQGEEGVDAGGLTREWYQVLSRQMFNPDYALFAPVASDRTSFHPNRTSWVNPEHLSFFKFIGRIIGKAIYDYKLLDCHFSRAVYRKILGKSVSIKDMESLDLDYYKSLLWMLENDITDIITETFSIEAEDYGEQKVIDLKPGGRDIPVTEENKSEYVRLVVEYRLINSVQEQLDHFLEGFHDIIPKDVIAIFDEQELELLISGMPDIDFEDWRSNTEYVNYSPSSAQIKWFWRAVRSFDAEEKAKLLQFATGTSKVPLNGFSRLEGVNGVQKFNIQKDYAGNNRLPSSHTCFNQVDLPEYDSYEQLRTALLTAITEGKEGFGWA